MLCRELARFIIFDRLQQRMTYILPQFNFFKLCHKNYVYFDFGVCVLLCIFDSHGVYVEQILRGVSRVANFRTLVWDLRLFVILQAFLLLFYICLKPRLFAYPITKPPANTLQYKNFYSSLQTIFATPDKNGKSAPTQLAPLVLHDLW